MSIVIPARRPASAAPARSTTSDQAARAVSFGAAAAAAADHHTAAASSPTPAPVRPGSAAVARSTPAAPAAAAAVVSSTLPPHARPDRPPFRPSSAHPRDAAFYSSSYQSSATAGVTARERGERSPTRAAAAAAAAAAAHSIAASSQPADAAAAEHSSTSVTSAGGGPSIPVRHTHRSSPSIRLTREAVEALAKAEALKTAEMNNEALKAHYTPLLSARHARLDELKLRLRKQEARLQTMQAWKLKALDKAASEPNALDFVLTRSGIVQSQAVRSKRIILQRTIIRQFLRTFRLLRSLKILHRHLRTMIPLLLDSPNSRMEPHTRRQLADVMKSWSREPVPLGPRASAARPAAGAAGIGIAMPTDHISPGAVPFSPQRGASVGWSPAPASESSPLAVNARKATERFFLSRHPHTYTQTLLSNLFDALPLLESAIVQNLRARHELDAENYAQMLRNTKLVARAEWNAGEIARKQATLQQLKEDVECIETEVQQARASYVSCIDRLRSLRRKQVSHQQRLNRLYYQEVAEQLGENYAVQLAMVQQGQPPPWTQAVKQDAPPMPPQLAASGAASSASAPAARNQTKLFLPTTLLGHAIPIAPDVIPRFDDAAADDGAAGSESQQDPSVAADPSVHIRQIDRAALLHRIDSLLARNPSRSPAQFDADSQAAREMHAAHERFLQRQALEADCALDEAHESAAVALERDGLQPFFVLAGNPPPASGHSSNAASRRSSRRRSNPRSMRPSDSLGELSPDEDDGSDGTHSPRGVLDPDADADADAGEDPEADRMFVLQRDHFADGVDDDATDFEESKQQQQQQHQQEEQEWFHPNHHREDSAPPLPPSLLNPPAKPLAPLHARTLSEVDWHATGPTMPLAHRRRQLNTEERLAAERAKGKTNPHEYFPLTRERVASMIEESAEDDEKGPSSGGGGGGGSGRRQPRGGFSLEDFAASLRAPAAGPNHDDPSSSLSQSTLAEDSTAQQPASSPESQAWWDAQPASSAADFPAAAAPASTPPRHRSSSQRSSSGPHAASSASPVVGLSASVYAASLEIATNHLLSLGYTEPQARQFAPHVVEVGAIRLPAASNSATAVHEPSDAVDRPSSMHDRPSSAASGFHSHSESGSRPGSAMAQPQGAAYATALMKRPGGAGGRVPVHTMHAYQQPSPAPSAARGVMAARPSSAHPAQQRAAASQQHPPPRPVASSSARPGSAAPARSSRPNSAAVEARSIALMSGLPVSCLVPKPPSRPRPATAGSSR